MPRCFETFCESGYQGKRLQLLVDDIHPAFECEVQPCSPFSFGPVASDEELAFFIIDPLHYDDVTGTVTPDAFQELFNRDLSTLRTSFAQKAEADEVRQELVARGNDRIPPQLRRVDEVCIASVRAIRQPVPDHRLLAVYDTGLDGKPAHASVFTTREALETRRIRKVARARIYTVMTNKRQSFADFRNTLG